MMSRPVETVALWDKLNVSRHIIVWLGFPIVHPRDLVLEIGCSLLTRKTSFDAIGRERVLLTRYMCWYWCSWVMMMMVVLVV